MYDYEGNTVGTAESCMFCGRQLPVEITGTGPVGPPRTFQACDRACHHFLLVCMSL